MIRTLISILGFGVSLFLIVPSAHAEPVLGLQPLQYVETLQKGERKKAFIDVTNPGAQTVAVQFTVQGFKQIDEKGSLAFYDDERLKSGVLLDYEQLDIPAKKTLRLYFIVDGSKLPPGDVFAAIFAQTKANSAVAEPSIRIGTLLILTNGAPGARQADIVSFVTPFLHVGTNISGEVKIKNTAPADTASGFFPEITIRLWPFGTQQTITGPLVYAGNTRTIKLDQSSGQFGLYKITASYESSAKARWVFLITGVWRWIILGILAIGVILSTGYMILRHYRKRKQ